MARPPRKAASHRSMKPAKKSDASSHMSPAHVEDKRELVILTGLSGSGKGSALKAFEPKVPGGEAKPEVWAKWNDFSQRMQTFAKKAEEMSKVAEGGNVASVTELMIDALPCKGCHDVYRTKK